jgi:hypothetical protein
MAVFIALSSPASISGMPMTRSAPRASQTGLAAGVASTLTALTGEVWEITADADLFIEFGLAPTGTGPARRRIKSGQTRYYMASAVGEKIAWSLL